MNQPDRRADRLAIARLNDDFCHELDRGDVDAFVGLFAADALYVNGPRILRGHDAIREFFIGRTRDGPRTSRHVASGLRIDFQDEARATGISVCVTFSAAGPAPIDSTLPAIVADFEDVYVLMDGSWRFAERHIKPMFRSVSR
jgi:uncharacterized protein (TIGR02246 family)